MQPYYEQSGITIYHGDCRDVLDDMRTHWGDRLFDLLLTDPPYGIDAASASFRGMAENGWTDFGNSVLDSSPADAEVLAACRNLCRQAVIWGGNYFDLPQRSGWLVWDKGQRDFSLADGELAWTSEQRALRIFSYSRAAALRDGKQHPTQKPLALMAWCLSQFSEAQSVFDPYLGTGTTLVEAKRVGLRGVGIEREERYCEIAAQRLSQEALPLEVA